MSEQQFIAQVVLFFAGVFLAWAGSANLTGWRRIAVYIAAAICAAPAVIGLFIVAVA